MSFLGTLGQYLTAPIELVLGFFPWSGGVTVLLLAVALLVVVLGLFRNEILIGAAIACFMSMHLNSAMFSRMDMRPASLFLAVLLGMARHRLPTLGVLSEGVMPATLLYIVIGLVTIPVSVDAGITGGTLLSVAVSVLIVMFLVSAASAEEIRSSVHVVTGAVVIISIIASIGLGGEAIEAGRWRGIIDNANPMGLMAGIFFLTARPDRLKVTAIPVAAVLLGSASRAATFGIAMVAGPAMLERFSPLVRRLAGGVAIIVAVPLLHSVFFGSGDTGGADLTRTNDSRSAYWGEAVHQISLEPLTGVGPGNAPFLVPSSALRPLVEIGLLGLVPLAMVIWVTVVVLRADRSPHRNIYLFLFINGAFEGWLFAGGSVFFMLFLLSSVLVTRDEPALVAEAQTGTGALRTDVRPEAPTGQTPSV